MPQITLDQRDTVLVATIANPPQGFMDDDTVSELAALLDRVEQDQAIRAVVFTGGLPGVFIRHYDVDVLEARGRAMQAKGLTFDPSRPVPESLYLTCLRRIETMPKAFIAAINGIAMGGGFELALACDLRLAAAGTYWLGLPEINIGLLPGAGGTQRLARLIGEGRALDLIMRGRTVQPAEAERLGIVAECVDGDLAAAAFSAAQEFGAKPPLALAHIKRLVRGTLSRPLDDGLADERTLFCDLMVSQESIDRMAAMNAGTRDIRDRDGG